MDLVQIGQKLRAAREAKSLSLRQIYDKTKIPLAHLESLDAGDPGDLPEPVYVAGFIKRFADVVGLDGQSLSDEYRHEYDQSVGPGPSWSRQPSPIIITTDSKKHLSGEFKPPTFKTYYFNAICIVVVIGLFCYIGLILNNNNQASQNDPSLMSLRETAGKYKPNPANIATNTVAAPVAAPADNAAKILLSASQHVWVEVKSASSGESLYTGYMEQGDKRNFQDAQGLRVRADNAGALTVDFQGKQEPLGQVDVVAEKTYIVEPSAVTTAESEKNPKAASTTSSTAGDLTTKTASAPHAGDKKDANTHIIKHHHTDETVSRQYIPGESIGSRSIDVPYRYTEGRLDAE